MLGLPETIDIAFVKTHAGLAFDEIHHITERKSMKRHEDLIPFSKEHHLTLSLANRILKKPQEDHHHAILAHKAELLAHFHHEEVQFTPYWPLLNRPELKKQFDQEHHELRCLLQEPFQAALLAERLIAHVRFEERILFEAFGKVLSTPQNE